MKRDDIISILYFILKDNGIDIFKVTKIIREFNKELDEQGEL